MTGYILNFTVYTLAMIGVIFIGFVIAKKSLSSGYFSNNKNKFLTIESCLNLEPRKNLYVIKAGNERFLISANPDGNTFLTKLEDSNIPAKTEPEEVQKPIYPNLIQHNMPVINFTDNRKTNLSTRSGIMRKLLDKLSTDTI